MVHGWYELLVDYTNNAGEHQVAIVGINGLDIECIGLWWLWASDNRSDLGDVVHRGATVKWLDTMHFFYPAATIYMTFTAKTYLRQHDTNLFSNFITVSLQFARHSQIMETYQRPPQNVGDWLMDEVITLVGDRLRDVCMPPDDIAIADYTLFAAVLAANNDAIIEWYIPIECKHYEARVKGMSKMQQISEFCKVGIPAELASENEVW